MLKPKKNKKINFRKKYISIIFILVTVISICFGMPVYPAETNQTSTKVEEFQYEENDGQISITKFIGKSQDIVIPQIINDKKVVYIADTAFMDCKEIKSIVIQDGVKKIGFRTFRGCSSLATISVPDSVEEIGAEAFEDCNSIVNISIPQNVTMIQNFSFAGCTSLNNIIIPNDVVYIGDYAFKDCIGLQSIYVPSGVSNIGKEVFYGCSQLSDVKIINVGNNPMIKIGKDGHVDAKGLSKIFDGNVDDINIKMIQPDEVKNQLTKSSNPSTEVVDTSVNEGTSTVCTNTQETSENKYGGYDDSSENQDVNREIAKNGKINKGLVSILLILAFIVLLKVFIDKRKNKLN